MPEAPTDSAHDAPQQARLLCWACLLVAIGAALVWTSDQARGLNTRWDELGGPAMILTYALAAFGLHRRPHRVDAIVTAALVPTSMYYLGALYVAAQDASPKGLYSMAANAQFMPLFYVAAFVALRKGAALVSGLHYAGLVALYLWQYGQGVTAPGGPIDAQGHVWLTLVVAHPCYIIALHYITALRGRLRDTERASHESKARFLAMLSHEIRSPLQAMLGSIDLLALKANTPPQQRAIERLRTAAAQLDTHLRDVTEYTRLEDPAWQLDPAQVDLLALVEEVCDSCQPQAQQRGLSLRCELPSSPDQAALRQAWTDATRLRQILANLIGNALKYTPQGGITVRAFPCPTGRHARIEVADSGIGIAVQDQERIFEPYVRLQDRRAADVEGSGLGLAVVKRLVERLGAELLVDSAPDQGSRFTVSLPLQR